MPQQLAIQQRLNGPTKTFTGNYYISSEVSLSTMDWGSPIATLSSSSTSYTDNNLMERNISRIPCNCSKWKPGHRPSDISMWATNLLSILQKGGILLMIDSTFITSLASEITRLENDLESEGWNVGKFYVGRSQAAIEGKNLLKTAVNPIVFLSNYIDAIGQCPSAFILETLVPLALLSSTRWAR